MTWYVDVHDDKSKMDIYEDGSEYTGKIKTVENSGGGLEIDKEVQTAMRETWREEVNLGNSPCMSVRAGEILMDMQCDCIEEGVPPSLQS